MADTTMERPAVDLHAADDVEAVLREVSLRHHELERMVEEKEQLLDAAKREIAAWTKRALEAEKKLAAIDGIVNHPLPPLPIPEHPTALLPSTKEPKNPLADSFVL